MGFFFARRNSKKCKCFAELYRIFFISITQHVSPGFTFLLRVLKTALLMMFFLFLSLPTLFPGKFIKDTPGKQILADGVSWGRNSTVEQFLVLFRGALRLEHHVPFSVPPGKLIILVEGTPTNRRTQEEAGCTCRGGCIFNWLKQITPDFEICARSFRHVDLARIGKLDAERDLRGSLGGFRPQIRLLGARRRRPPKMAFVSWPRSLRSAQQL